VTGVVILDRDNAEPLRTGKVAGPMVSGRCFFENARNALLLSVPFPVGLDVKCSMGSIVPSEEGKEPCS
jgi:hypothetical protein